MSLQIETQDKIRTSFPLYVDLAKREDGGVRREGKFPNLLT
jgi:hypothetical protein